MSNLQARVTAGDRAFHVEGYERIEYDLLYVDGVFAPENTELADSYHPYGRALAVVDDTVYRIYGEVIQSYFDHHGIELTVIPVQIRETAKSLETYEQIVSRFDAFGLVRTEPVLVVGGGLTTDVAGFACASYRRNTPYIRIPTTLIGLIDASVSIKVAVNHGKHKNRLGAYHASKYAVEAISDALRFEVKGFGVKVVIIQPGLIRTDFSSTAVAAIGADEGPYGAFNAGVAQATKDVYEKGPMAHFGGDPDDVAKAIEKAITARRPKIRMRVTPSAHMLIAQRRMMTDGMWDRFLTTQFTAPRPDAPAGR